MKVLLIVPRYGSISGYDYMFPLGLDYILTVLKKHYDVDCLNLNHVDSPKDAINNALNLKDYDFVGTGSNSMGYSVVKMIIDTVREHKSRPKIVLGGQIITTEPELIFDALRPDFGVIGEGEETIVELLEAVKDGRDLSLVDGIIFRKDKIVQTPKRVPVENLDSIPFPELEAIGFKELLENTHCNFAPYTSIFDKPRIYPILASRSCPFQCTFCYHEGKFRKRSIKNVMDELNIAVKKYKINLVSLYDDCFAFDRGRIIEFCSEIKKLQSEISWELKWMCQLIVTVVDAELLKILKDAGCVAVSYGFESISPIVLKSMRKHITPEQIDAALKKTLDAGLFVIANFIFGDVAETIDTANATIDYWKENCKGQVSFTPVRPYPGSELYKHCLEKGIIKDRLEFIKSLSALTLWYDFNMTDNMSNEELKGLIHRISHLEAKYYKRVRPIKTQRYNGTYSFKVRCPFCAEVIEYNNISLGLLSASKSWIYGVPVICRHCYMRFKITNLAYDIYATNSSVMALAYAYLKRRKQVDT